MYLLNGHERHRVTCATQMRMLCVFNPPVSGDDPRVASPVQP